MLDYVPVHYGVDPMIRGLDSRKARRLKLPLLSMAGAGLLILVAWASTQIQSSGPARPAGPAEARVESRLEIISVDGKDRRVVYREKTRFEAPNWSRDGKYLLFNREGRIYTIPVEGGEPRPLNTGSATRCNNDHGLSPDGKLLAI